MIAGTREKLIAKIFTVEVLGAILVVVSLQALSYGISSSLLDTNTQYFGVICLIAAGLSFGLSKSKSKGYQASVWIAALGLISIWILGARLTTPLLDLGNAVINVTLKFVREFLPQIIPAIKGHTTIVLPAVDASGISDAWNVIAGSSSALAGRLQAWLAGLIGRVAVNDTLVRNMVWTLILWLFSAWMGWFAGKRNAVASVLPSIFLLAMVISYSEYKVESLWLMVIILLLLMGLWNYGSHTQQWQKGSMDYSDSIRYDTGLAVVLLTLTVGIVSFITPSISWKDIRDRLRTQNNAADSLGLKEHPLPAKPVGTQKPSLPRDHLLSGGFAQSQNIVMLIKTGELPPIPDPAFAERAPRYYWRSVVYDRYVGAGWITSTSYTQTYAPNTPIIPGLLNGYKPVHMQVQMMEPEGKLYWTGILFSADVPFIATWRLKPKSNLFADQSTLLQADMFATSTSATSYQTESYVPQVTIEQLRSAPTEYPNDIIARYFILPSTVPDRVRQLAKTITNGITNPYNKAKAIERYLRTYPYDLDIPAPPEGQDVTDYFLFDLKRGYCDYYATAMAVLARASGLPARFVSGYSTGSYDAPNAEYVVRELNAHSWAEVYFPSIGWVEFEPTASQPEIQRQESASPVPANRNNDGTASNLLTRFRIENISAWILPIIWVFLLAILYFVVIERWWYLRSTPGTAVERIYQRLYRLGRPLAGEHSNSETAYEFMQKLNGRIDKLKVASSWKRLYVSTQRDVRLLTNAYQASLFKQHQTNKDDASLALQTWKHLRWRLILARFNAHNETESENH